MKENIVGLVNNFGNQIWRRQVTQNSPQMKPLEKSQDFLNRLGLSWLPYYAKGFYLNSKQVKILHDPKSFYNLILEKIQLANERIVLASLYLGTGTLENNLVKVLNQRLFEKPGLSVRIVIDCLRGSRGEFNSRKMLLPILQKHSSCQVSLYQTPIIREPFLSLMPERYKEIIGLHHIKVYLFDNDLIISGANLSSDYFTNRQDRYILVKDCKELADFVDGFVEKISQCSLQLDSNDQLHLHPAWHHHPVKSKRELFMKEAQSRLNSFYQNFTVSNTKEEFDTVIFPLLEMGHFNIHMDSTVTTKIIEASDNKIKAFLTTGYFNLTDLYSNSMINKSRATFDILMAHPTANGFYKAKGPAGGIPFAYTELARQFLNKILSAEQGSRIRMHEYIRPGWTYHAKGLWLTRAGSELPFLTMIGSPNFGERSIHRDLECQFLIATENEGLQQELLKEKELLYSTTKPFNEAIPTEGDRAPPLWVKIVVLLFRTYL